MKKKPSPSVVRVKQKRLSPEDRREEFVRKATEFFSEEGFNGGTRELARRLGVTQPLLYRYFPSKEELIKEVYRKVYLEPLDTGWEKASHRPVAPDPGSVAAVLRELHQRDFHPQMAENLSVLRPERARHQSLVCRRCARQDSDAHHQGMQARSGACRSQTKPTGAELEMAWVFHGGIFYYGVRRFIYEMPSLQEKQQVIANAVDGYLAGFPRAAGNGTKRPVAKSNRLNATAGR